jgi:protein arginine kinase activator
MKCDNCDNEATVHEVTIHKGHKLEKHLCEQCAQEVGIDTQSEAIPAALLSQFVSGAESKTSPGATSRGKTCGQCGMTYAKFRQHGLLGCAECYEAFEDQLTPLLDRAQEGGAEHLGKTPRRSVGALQHQRQISLLRKQLAEALQTERYERAADLRDELNKAGVDITTLSPSADSHKEAQA